MLLAAALAIRNLVRFRSLTLRSFLPLILLAAIHGTMLSQQLWGSTYAIWPLLAILIADLLAFLAGRCGTPSRAIAGFFPRSRVSSPPHFSFAAASTRSAKSVSPTSDIPDGPVEHSAFPQLAGASTPGP